MSNKFKGKYRNGSFRLKGYDYRKAGAYFITIVTENRIPYFGEIIASPKPQLIPTEIAEIVEKEWLKTPLLRPEMNLILDEFVIMPDHFHAILIIGQNEFNADSPLYLENKFGPQKKNLASIMRGFKSAVSTEAKKKGIDFGWQRLFHEHIIRNESAYWFIREYIMNNPKKWVEKEALLNEVSIYKI